MPSASKRIFVFAGLLAAPVTCNLDSKAPSPTPPSTDSRLVRLTHWLQKNDCPLNKYAADFIEAADNNELDWRLLPSISFVESRGGKDFRNNNVFGWDSCNQRFPSVRAGIHYVASRLANSELYKEKSLEGKLRTYNPREQYTALVKSVMRSIASEAAFDAAN
jgi:hypothetical protein